MARTPAFIVSFPSPLPSLPQLPFWPSWPAYGSEHVRLCRLHSLGVSAADPLIATMLPCRTWRFARDGLRTTAALLLHAQHSTLRLRLSGRVCSPATTKGCRLGDSLEVDPFCPPFHAYKGFYICGYETLQSKRACVVSSSRTLKQFTTS